jgi:hypothetical protein
MRVMVIFDALTIPFEQRIMASLGNAASQGCFGWLLHSVTFLLSSTFP